MKIQIIFLLIQLLLPLASLGERPAFCSLKPKRGTCRAVRTRWYFNPISGTCQVFTFSGCSGNRNNFASRLECRSVCRALQPRCYLAAITGSCKSSHRRWYFNAATSRCELFIYGGCDGNANNFINRDACLNSCS